jgi:hypothetical protein
MIQRQENNVNAAIIPGQFDDPGVNLGFVTPIT